MYKYIWAFGIACIMGIFSSFNPLAWVGGFFFTIFAIFINLLLFWYMLKLFYLTFKNFALIILTIITGPFEILLGTVTGMVGFGSWLRRLISYLAFYPMLALLFFLAFFFLAQSLSFGLSGIVSYLTQFLGTDAKWLPFNPTMRALEGNSWSPPLTVGTAGIAGTSAFGVDALLWLMVSLVIVMLTPKVTEIIQGIISGKPFAYGTAIGEATGPAKGVAGAAVSGLGTHWVERFPGGQPGGPATPTQRGLQAAIDFLAKAIAK